MVTPQTPGVPDHARQPVHTVGQSPKALVSGGVGLLVGIAVAVLNAVTTNDLLGGLHPSLQVLLLAAIPPVLTYLGAYSASPGKVTTAPRTAPPVDPTDMGA